MLKYVIKFFLCEAHYLKTVIANLNDLLNEPNSKLFFFRNDPVLGSDMTRLQLMEILNI